MHDTERVTPKALNQICKQDEDAFQFLVNWYLLPHLIPFLIFRFKNINITKLKARGITGLTYGGPFTLDICIKSIPEYEELELSSCPVMFFAELLVRLKFPI